jgi:hypothetical protein
MKTPKLSALAVVILTLLAPAASMAASSAPHVRVDSCRPDAGKPAGSWSGNYGSFAPYGVYTAHSYVRGPYPYRGHAYYEPATPPTLSIGYVNESPKTATTIDFGLVAKGHTVAVVRDAGTFSTGAKIDHVFALDRNVFPLGTSIVSCLPLHIEYSDGTTWSHSQH